MKELFLMDMIILQLKLNEDKRKHENLLAGIVIQITCSDKIKRETK